jgi:hypothetical protein
MRPIDGDALRDRLQNLADDEWNRSTTTSWAEAFSECADMLEDAPTIEQEPHWIPCSERLPFAEYGESDNVLATCGHRDGEDTSIRWIKTLYFNGGNWCYPTGETYDQKVYAWMPLPEPYREGES